MTTWNAAACRSSSRACSGSWWRPWGLLGGVQVTAARVWQIPTARFPSKGRAFVRLCGSLLLFALVFYVSAVVRRLGVVAGLAGSLAGFTSFAVAFF
ncbi:MAG TPA: hypothetical protein PKE56_11610, partial [Acidimicrobiales bacterium]|nr:hypothetical protein [Acidimicrobiales bacterium]